MTGLLGWPALERNDVERHIRQICTLGNRYVGTTGEAATRDFLVDRFSQAGLREVRAESVELLAYMPEEASCAVLYPEIELPAVGLQYTATGEIEGEALYLGRPTSVEEIRDLEKRLPPLAGRIAVLHTFWPWLFAEYLISRGVLAIAVICETPEGTLAHLTAQLYPVPSPPDFAGRPLPVPGVTIDRAHGARLVALIASGNVRLRIRHQARYQPVATANIVGEIPGTSDECLVVGAHYDTQFEGVGAQDNATGLGALLAMAEAWASRQFARTIKIVAFCAEEQGMWGATEYCRRHRGELDLTVAMVNLDALAWALPGHRAILADPAIAAFAAARAAELGWKVEKITNASLLRAADLNPFIDAGVPGCWFWRFPPQHPYYHSAGDVPELLDMGAVTEVANVAAYTAIAIASEPEITFGRALGLAAGKHDLL